MKVFSKVILTSITFLLAASLSAFASMPTYWGVGLNASIPISPGRDSSWSTATPNSAGLGVSLEFGQQFNPKIGYNIRLSSFESDRGKQKGLPPYEPDPKWEPTNWSETSFHYVSFGISFAGKYDIDYYANVTCGFYKTLCIKTEETIINSQPGYIYFPQEKFYQDGALGFEVGASKKIKWGLYGQVGFHYTPLDKKKVKVDSIQLVSIGLKYLWGNNK